MRKQKRYKNREREGEKNNNNYRLFSNIAKGLE